MPPDDPSDRLNFEPHRVPWSDFDELARGRANPSVVRQLRRAEHSRRKLLLRAVDEQLKKKPDVMGPLPPPDQAWELLDRVERSSRRTLDLMLAHPYTGAWAGYAIRLLHEQITGVCPVWVHIGHLHALTAAAAIRAGIAFETRIPVWNGGAMLPTLGMARMATNRPYSVAYVRGDANGVEIGNDQTVVRLPDDRSSDAPNWWGLRRLATRSKALGLSAWLDDLDPYRGLYEPAAPQRLRDQDRTVWRNMLDDAWQLLVHCLPELATGFPPGFDSLVPKPEVPFRSLSASTEEAFGSAIVAKPVDAPAFAATLVHEFHHILLSGLIHLIPLHTDDRRERFRTLWRDDPRPIGGVMQGVYAFFGVTAFWRALAQREKGERERRAQFEFGYWRAGTWDTLRAISGDPSLTSAGQRFVDGIAERLGPWQREPLPAEVGDLATAAVADHDAGWRLRHTRPNLDSVADFADSWLAGRRWPTSADPDLSTMVTPLSDGSWSGARTDLIRVSLRDPRPETIHDAWPAVPGATTADVAYLTGDNDAAIQSYMADLTENGENPDSWIGLGLALEARRGDSAGARALLSRPELVRAVYRHIRDTGATVPSPDELAAWVGRAVC